MLCWTLIVISLFNWWNCYWCWFLYWFLCYSNSYWFNSHFTDLWLWWYLCSIDDTAIDVDFHIDFYVSNIVIDLTHALLIFDCNDIFVKFLTMLLMLIFILIIILLKSIGIQLPLFWYLIVMISVFNWWHCHWCWFLYWFLC